MEKRSLGLFLIALGIIFLIIALMTIWSMSLEWALWKGYYLIFSVPLLVFSIFTIYFGFYLILKEKIDQKLKGFFLIIDGIIPIIISVYVILDDRLLPLEYIRNMILFPLILVGIFLMTYGIFLITSERLFSRPSIKSKVTWILGLISTIIGIINTIIFVIILFLYPNQPTIFLISLFLVDGVLFIFGIHLILQGLNKTVKIKKRK